MNSQELAKKSTSGAQMPSEENINRSLQLLDEIIAAPKTSVFRISSTPRRSYLYSKKDDSTFADFSPLKSAEKKKYGADYRSSILPDMSLTINYGEYSHVLDESTTPALPPDEESWKMACHQLYEEFLESYQSRTGEYQVFDQIAEFIQSCSDSLQSVTEIKKKIIASQARTLAKDQAWLENERNTWRLVHCLYLDRISSEANAEGEDDMIVDVPNKYSSEKDAVIQFYKSDQVVRECQLVIDWLEKNARDELHDPLCPRPEHFTDKTVAWENTLHALMNKDKAIPYGSTRPIVNSLDPDAPLRESKSLHDLDQEDEARLMKKLFSYIRCGSLVEAQQLCIHCGQPWRAATLEGWRLYHDPNLDARANGELKKPVEGNPNRDIWKVVAWGLTEDERLSLYTRATYAALCGNLKVLQQACQTWHDMLWAHVKVIVDIKVETEIRRNPFRTYQHLPQAYWNNKISLEQVFVDLAASKDVRIQDEANIPYHIVQKFLILDDIGMLMDEIKHWLGPSPSSHLLRFLAHLVLFFRQIGKLEKEDIGDAVLEAYVKVLIEMNEVSLVPFYLATLPQGKQVGWCAYFLQHIKDLEQKKNCLKLVEEAGLDVAEVTKRVVENIRHKEVSVVPTDLQGEVTKEDEEKIDALDWVVMYPEQREEAMWQTNAIVRHFLALGKLEAARRAFFKMPQDSIGLILEKWHVTTGQGKMPQRTSSAIRENLSLRTYLDAHESFSYWFQYYHHAKPKTPVLPSGASFTERVAFEHREMQFKADLDRWKISVEHQSREVKSRLYNVLLFPEGGWLVDVVEPLPEDEEMEEEDDDEEHSRQLQMENLRKLCIPQIVLLLHSVMHSIGEYQESVELSEIIVSEQYQLYKVFTKEKLGEILDKVAESALALLDQKKDPFGHPFTS